MSTSAEFGSPVPSYEPSLAMTRTIACVATLLLICLPGKASDSPRAFADTASFARELRGLQHSLHDGDAASLSNSLPEQWQVQTRQGTYFISSAPLRKILDSGAPVSEAALWIDHLREQMDGADSSGPNLELSRSRLTQILAQPEFAPDQPPSALERLWDKIRTAISDWLDSIFRFRRTSPLGPVLLFALIATLALAILFLLFRNDHASLLLKLQAGEVSVPARSWEQWLLSAKEASDRGDFRKAIQCSYWAGISRLQESGALPADLTKTPREYLRVLSSPALSSAMRSLTLHLETYWYGRDEATSAELSACFQSLEELGCKVR